MTQTTNERLWEVIQTCVNEGSSVAEFLAVCKAHWQEALRDRVVVATEDWERAIRQEAG